MSIYTIIYASTVCMELENCFILVSSNLPPPNPLQSLHVHYRRQNTYMQTAAERRREVKQYVCDQGPDKLVDAYTKVHLTDRQVLG